MSSQKIPFSGETFVVHILPALGCVYGMAVLVQVEGTRVCRLALLPVLVWLAWRGSFVDMAGGDPKLGQLNTGLVTHLCAQSLRATVWAMARAPFRRQNDASPFWNAWDLMVNTRGIGWNWSRGLVVPRPVYDTDSRVVFVLVSTVRLGVSALGFDACIQLIRAVSPDTFGSLVGGSIFDPALPLHRSLLQAVAVSFLAVWMTYFAIQWSYQLVAIVFTLLFRQHPSQWPPMFDAPWRSTSLTELWGRRWHQAMRELVTAFGVRPFGSLFGRLGGLFGAFLFSGVFHDIELRAFGRGGHTLPVVGFWVMNSVGVILERVWARSTGRRVGGVLGWLWTFGWLVVWGVWVVDAWARAGRFGALSLPGEVAPSLWLVARCLY